MKWCLQVHHLQHVYKMIDIVITMCSICTVYGMFMNWTKLYTIKAANYYHIYDMLDICKPYKCVAFLITRNSIMSCLLLEYFHQWGDDYFINYLMTLRRVQYSRAWSQMRLNRWNRRYISNVVQLSRKGCRVFTLEILWETCIRVMSKG